jgi:lipid-A-disaccharide synthase
VGHPFVEIVRPSLTKEDFCRAVGIDVNSPVLTIMPGSRENEVKRHMPIMMDVLEKITQKVKNLTILLPLAENIEQEKIEQYKRDGIRIVYLKGASYDALNYSNLAIIASGSATLEAAILGAPTIVIYKVSFLSYVVARLIVNVKYISLPNIIAGKEVFPEFIQTLEAEKIAEKALYMLINGREKIKNELEDIKMKLGRNNAYKLAARHIMDFLENTYGSLS